MAQESQRKSSALDRPLIDSCLENLGSVAKQCIASAISSASSGSTRKAASPATSGMDEIFDVITGQPQVIASRIGKPKPSIKDTYIKAVACRYRPRNSASLTCP